MVVEVTLIITGLVFIAWLYMLVRQTQRSLGPDHTAPTRPVVPLNLTDAEEAIIISEDRGRIVYANDAARDWFGIDGGAPNLALMAERTRPSDSLLDLLAGEGYASFRVGQRSIEAVSHSIPVPGGRQTMVVMRELTGRGLQSYAEFDPLRALAIVGDISRSIGHELQLSGTVDAILQSIEQSISFDSAEINLWQPETRTLRPVGLRLLRTPTGSLSPSSNGQTFSEEYRAGEGYSGWIATYRQPLLNNNIPGRTDVTPRAFQAEFQSYLGVPLTIGDDFLGTLELLHRERNAFSQRDTALLQAISGQAAAAIEVSRQYTDQTSRVNELGGLQQIAEAIGHLGDPTEMYGQLTQRIATLMNVDICGVLLFDEEEDIFFSQPPFYGVPDTLIADYRLNVVPDSELYTIWHHRPWWFTNDPDAAVIQAMGFEDLRTALSITGLALVPMITGTRRTGLLLVANPRGGDPFDEDDMRVLMSFAAQAAVVSENARLYLHEQRRTRELGGLQQIAQAIGVLRSAEDLYGQITQRIAALMEVQVCGILLHDSHDHVLTSQRPFFGLDDEEQINFYQIPARAGSVDARLWQEQDTWHSNNLRADPVARETDLARLALSLGMTKTVIATLVTGGTRIGIIQVANKLDRSDFTTDDARLLSIFAGQAAILIDNARLYREMQRRTHEAEGLRAVTEIASAVMPNPETVESVLIALSNLLEANVVMVSLVAERTGELVIGPDFAWGIELPEAVHVDAYLPGFENTALISRKPLLTSNPRTEERLLPPYLELARRYDLHSIVQVPLVIQQRSIGELTIANSFNAGGFTTADVQLLTSIATQVAAMVDRMRLYEATDQTLRARVQELDALSRVGTELGRTLELSRILDVIRQELLRSTGAQGASIVLLSPGEEWPNPDSPQIEQRYGEGRYLRALAEVERAAVLRNDVLQIDNYNTSEFDATPSDARSALVVPIHFADEPIGLMHLYSRQERAFATRVLDFVLALTDQATIAIGNARRYQTQLMANRQLQVRTEQMGRIFALGEMFRQGATLVEMLEQVARSVQETVGFNIVLISLVDEHEQTLERTAHAGLPDAVFEEMQRTAPSLEQARGLMQSRYAISNSFFLPAEGSEDLTSELPVYRSGYERVGPSPRAWDPEDLMIVPFYGANNVLLGLMSVDDPQSGRRPDQHTVEALEIFANQAAFSLGNYRLISRIQEEAESTRRERDRLAQLHLVASEIQNAPDVPSRLQVVADGIHEAGWGRVVITLRDERLEPTAMIQAGYSPDEAIQLSDEVLPGDAWRRWINDLAFHELKMGAGYFLRYDHPWVKKNVRRAASPEPSTVADDVWHPQDVVYLPLVGQDQKRIIGIIRMDSPVDGRVPTETSLQPFELFASQAAAAIETTRLYLETVRAAEQEARLNELMEVVSGSISPEAVIQAIGRGLQQMVPFTRMSVALYNTALGQFDVLRAEIALDATVAVTHAPPMPVGSTATGQAFLEKKARLFGLTQDEASRKTYIDLAAWFESGERSTLIVPMVAGGQAVGAMRLGSELENAFGFQENLELIQRLSNLSAVALENARLFAQARDRANELDEHAQRLALINRITTRLTESYSPLEIYQIALEELQAQLGAKFGGVVLLENETTGQLVIDTHPDVDGIDDIGPINLEGYHAFETLRKRRRTVVSEDVLADPRFRPVHDTLEKRGTRSLMLLPVFLGAEVLGSIGLDFVEPRTFTDAEIELSETIANQVSTTLEKVNLLAETERRALELDEQANRLAILNQVSARLSQAQEPQVVYRVLVEGMQEAFSSYSAGLMIIDEENQSSYLAHSTHPLDRDSLALEIPLQGNPIAEAIMATHQPFMIADVMNEPEFEDMRPIMGARGLQAMLIVPVLMGERVLGTVGLDSDVPRRFSSAEIEMAQTVANQAAIAIERSRLFVETQQRASELDAQAQRLALINRVSTRLAQTLDTKLIYEIVLTELIEALNIPQGGIMLFEGEKGRLVASSRPEDLEGDDILLPLENNRSIEIVRETHKPLVSREVLSDPLFEPAWGMLGERGIQSLMIVPLIVTEQVIGTIGLDALEHRDFTDAEIELAETIASQASLAMEKARLYDETLGLTIFNQAVVESIQQGIVVLDQELHVRRINRYMSERYGWSSAAVSQRLFEYRPDYAEFLREPIAVSLGMGEPQVQYDVHRRDELGLPSIRNYYVYPMMEGRNVTGIVLLLEDVTERARLEADLDARAVQMAALSEVSSQITATLESGEVIGVILDALGRVVEYDGVSLWLRSADADELEIVAARGYEDPDSPDASDLIGLRVEIAYSALFGEMARDARVINVGDVSAGDPRFPYGSAAVYKNWLGAPLISEGQVVGVLTLEKREPNYYDPLHEQLTFTFANQAAVALNNAQLFAETRTRTRELDDQAQRLALLNRVALALAQTLDLENILEIALRETAIALNIEEGAAMQVDPSNDVAVLVVEYPRGDEPPDQVIDFRRSQALDRVRHALIPVVVENLEADPMRDELRAMMRHDRVMSTMLVPLVVGGQVIGVLRLDSVGKRRQFTSEQIELAQTIASQAGIAVQNAGLFEQSAIRTRELETLFESAQATAVTLDLDEVVRRVSVQMLGAMNADACTVFLWDDVSNQLTVRGEISARPEGVPSPQIGEIYSLENYPLRESALRESELKTARTSDDRLPDGERELNELHQAASRLLIPLVVNEVSIGLVEVETLNPRRVFKGETKRLARTLASQAAISIENARLQTETRRTVEEMYIINDMSGALSSASDIPQLLAVIEAQLPSLTDAQAIYVALYEPDRDAVVFPLAVLVREDVEIDMAEHSLGQDEFSMIIRQKAPLLLAGENLTEVRRSLSIESMLPEAKCFLGVPLFAGDEVIGVLAVRDDEDPLAFSHNDQRILTTVGAQLGVAIQSTRLFQQTLELAEELDRRVQERTAELDQERQHIQTLYQITTEMTTSLDMDRLLARALEMVAQSVGATQGAILAVDPISERLYFRARLGWPAGQPETQDDGDSVRLDQGLAGWAVQNRENLIVDNVQEDERWTRDTDGDDNPRAAIVSLIESNEDILGVTMLYGEKPGAFNDDHMRLVSAASNQVANAMNNAELYSLIRDQAERLGAMLREQQVESTKSDAILDSVADGVMVVDNSGQVIVFNQAAARILELPSDQVIHQRTSAIAGLYGAGKTQWAEAIDSWMQDPTTTNPGDYLEERITLDDERVISVRLSPVHMGDQFLGMVSIFRDITQEVEVDRLKSEFVATVSHELRTPMTSIKGYADLLLLGAAGDVTEQQQRFLETIKQNADRLSILVNDLLDISRIDQGRMDLKFSEIDVSGLLDTVAVHLRGRSEDEQRTMNVAVELPEDVDLKLWGDYDKVQQIMTNLADNAFNYTPEDGHITFAAQEADDSHIVISVADSGIGIPPEVSDRIFERFFRGDETHDLVMDTPGTGLGLSIVRELVNVHRGRIWFESELGHGTTFFVLLPSRASEPQQAETSEA